MKKIIVLSLMTMCLTFMLCGCGQADDKGTTSQSSSTPKNEFKGVVTAVTTDKAEGAAQSQTKKATAKASAKENTDTSKSSTATKTDSTTTSDKQTTTQTTTQDGSTIGFWD